MSIKLAKNLPQLVFETDTPQTHYQVWDILYDSRPSRVLYSGQRQTAQSGIACDNNPDLLFDYNQRFYELVSGVLPKRLLLIGGGMYTLPMALLKALPSIVIDVVEIDDRLDDIARRFFDLSDNPRLRIIHQDGCQYLDTTTASYDMILIDAFTQAETPGSLIDAAAAHSARRRLSEGGLVAYNAIASYHGPRAKLLRQRLAALGMAFNTLTIFPAGHGLSLWLPQNLLLIAQTSGNQPLGQFLRYPALDDDNEPFKLIRDFGRR